MPLKTRQIGPCFAAEVEGVDMRKPLSPEEVAAIHAGMDQYAVLVFHGQSFTDDEQLAFTQSLGDIEHSIGASLRAPDEYRLPTTFADVSNLDKNNQVYARDLTARRTEIVSVNAQGMAGFDFGAFASLSGNGNTVAFYSNARDLVRPDINGFSCSRCRRPRSPRTSWARWTRAARPRRGSRSRTSRRSWGSRSIRPS